MTLTREQFNTLINRKDEVGMHAIGRALVHLFNRQTEAEKASNDTKTDNNRGFTHGDARQGSLAAKYYLKHKKLLDWQMAQWTRPAANKSGTRLGKYYRQIAEEAARKAASKAARLPLNNDDSVVE